MRLHLQRRGNWLLSSDTRVAHEPENVGKCMERKKKDKCQHPMCIVSGNWC